MLVHSKCEVIYEIKKERAIKKITKYLIKKWCKDDTGVSLIFYIYWLVSINASAWLLGLFLIVVLLLLLYEGCLNDNYWC